MPNQKVPLPEQRPGKISPIFQLGQVVATPAAMAHLEKHAILPAALLSRHQHCDWGDINGEDATSNEQAIQTGARIISMYWTEGRWLWVITEAVGDAGRRASTCILFPEEY